MIHTPSWYVHLLAARFHSGVSVLADIQCSCRLCLPQAELLAKKGEEYAQELAVLGAPEVKTEKKAAKSSGGGKVAAPQLASAEAFPSLGA